MNHHQTSKGPRWVTWLHQPADHPRHSSPWPGGSLDPCINKDKKLGSWCLGCPAAALWTWNMGWEVMRETKTGFLREQKKAQKTQFCLSQFNSSSSKTLTPCFVCAVHLIRNKKHERMKPWKASHLTSKLFILLRPMGYEMYIPAMDAPCNQLTPPVGFPSF